MNELRGAKPIVHLRDYRAPAWCTGSIDLCFDLDVHETIVEACLHLHQDPARADEALRLDGEALDLIEVELDGVALGAGDYRVDARGLELPQARGEARVRTRVRLRPDANTALEGLYLSGSREHGFLLTQCEAEGFRRITYAQDRPDVLAVYRVTLRAARERFPVLLAGGNPDGSGETPDGRHWARFVDPQPKPSYLFALAAGRLHALEDRFRTGEGRDVRLCLWTEVDALARCAHAMRCLKAAFAWDEQRFGRHYRLDAFHVVATPDFTMGAMENTGLNIFNSKYLLADPEHATDEDYRHVLAVVGHEYFHNWSGNRVTCRDWFQLSLKEGLTVYREQEFESDLASRTRRRIDDVRLLWRSQFSEDAGPLAHAVRPEQYAEINNFYTATVYEKGAEIVRMLATLLGRDGFRRGLDLYFARHDGAAVTVEDFVAALGDANGHDLSAWLAWYRQAGTPELHAHGDYDAAAREYRLSLRQHTAPTPGQPDKHTLPIPVAMALFDRDGAPLSARLDGEPQAQADERVLLLDAERATFCFREVAQAPVLSLLRGCSAPVRLHHAARVDDLAVLLRHDSDGFNRWYAGDALGRRAIGGAIASGRTDAETFAAWCAGLAAALDEDAIDPALLGELLGLADAVTYAEGLAAIDPQRVHDAHNGVEQALAAALHAPLARRHAALSAQADEGDAPAAQARRLLRNRCLVLLCRVDADWRAVAARQCREASRLGDRLAGLNGLAHGPVDALQDALDAFAARYADEPLVLDKWFSAQALLARADTVERVQSLLTHPAFRWDNPNKVYALLLAFAQRNLVAFHRADGAGYRLLGDAIARVDALTPQVAARLATSFGTWRRFEPHRAALMRTQLERFANDERCSPDLLDIAVRAGNGESGIGNR